MDAGAIFRADIGLYVGTTGSRSSGLQEMLSVAQRIEESGTDSLEHRR